MTASMPSEATVVVIFGAGGDLTWRKLVPALYDLACEDWLPAHFLVVGLDMKPMSDNAFRTHLRDGVAHFARHRPPDAAWHAFAAHLSCVTADFGDLAASRRWLSNSPGRSRTGAPRSPASSPWRRRRR
jgi:glucose-6-phosphate 1-dehydrogenase